MFNGYAEENPASALGLLHCFSQVVGCMDDDPESVHLDSDDSDDSSQTISIDEGAHCNKKRKDLSNISQKQRNLIASSGPINAIEFGKRLKWARETSDIEVGDVCVQLQINWETLRAFEAGCALPDLGLIVKIADVLRVQIDYLLGRIEDGLAEHKEAGINVFAHAVKKSLEASVRDFSNAAADHFIAINSMKAQMTDDAARLVARITELQAAYARMKELNPTFDEEIQGGSRVEAAIKALDIEASWLQIYSEQAARAKRLMMAMSADAEGAETKKQRIKVRRVTSTELEI